MKTTAQLITEARQACTAVGEAKGAAIEALDVAIIAIASDGRSDHYPPLVALTQALNEVQGF